MRLNVDDKLPPVARSVNPGFTQHIATALTAAKPAASEAPNPFLPAGFVHKPVQPKPDRVRIVLVPNDPVIGHDSAESAHAADCTKVDLMAVRSDDPMTSNNESLEELDEQFAEIATAYGGDDHLLEKLVLDSHGGTNLIQVDVQGIRTEDDPFFTLVDEHFFGVASIAAKNVERNGNLKIMGCSHAPDTPEGKVVLERLGEVAKARHIYITVTASEAQARTYNSGAMLYIIKPDGSIMRDEKDFRDYNRKKLALEKAQEHGIKLEEEWTKNAALASETRTTYNAATDPNFERDHGKDVRRYDGNMEELAKKMAKQEIYIQKLKDKMFVDGK